MNIRCNIKADERGRRCTWEWTEGDALASPAPAAGGAEHHPHGSRQLFLSRGSPLALLQDIFVVRAERNLGSRVMAAALVAQLESLQRATGGRASACPWGGRPAAYSMVQPAALQAGLPACTAAVNTTPACVSSPDAPASPCGSSGKRAPSASPWEALLVAGAWAAAASQASPAAAAAAAPAATQPPTGSTQWRSAQRQGSPPLLSVHGGCLKLGRREGAVARRQRRPSPVAAREGPSTPGRCSPPSMAHTAGCPAAVVSTLLRITGQCGQQAPAATKPSNAPSAAG